MSKIWEHYGAHDPYYGVLSDESFRGTQLKDEVLARFFASGVEKVDEAITLVEQTVGALNFDTALDYGCGAGRLSRRLSERFSKVIAVDISESMLQLARSHLTGRNVYFENAACMSDQPVSFLVSLLVFQHIPVSAGMAILPALARRVHGAGVIDIPVRYTGGWVRSMMRRGKAALRSVMPNVEPQIPMYIYDPAAVRRVLENERCCVTTARIQVPMFEKDRVIFQRG